MSSSDTPILESDSILQRLALLAGMLLIVIPFLQAGSQIWPLQLTNIQWRFGAANALSSVLVLPFCGLAMLVAVARVSAQAVTLRVLGVLSLLLTLGLAASFVVFVLDALQLKTIVKSSAMPQYLGASTRVAVATVIFAASFAILTMGCFRKLPAAFSAARKGVKKADEGVGLIVGQAE